MITINPENPSSDDQVEFTLFIHGCGLHETSEMARISQFVFEADVVAMPCIVLMPPMPYPWSVGRLEAGEYQVILKQGDFQPETKIFSVSQGELPFPEPTIPTMSSIGAILLALALAWIANKALKRTHERRLI